MALAKKYTVNTDYSISLDHQNASAVSMVDVIDTGIITTSNENTVKATSNPTQGSYVEVDATGKGTVTIQVAGTWACAPNAGIFVVGTVDGANWILLAAPDRLIKISSLAYCSQIENGLTDIWQLQVAGLSIVRVIAIGADFTGAAQIAVRATVATRDIQSDAAGTPAIRFLTSVGDGTGTYNLNGNYATTPLQAFYRPPPAKKFYINSFSIQISDNTAFNQLDYGGITGGLLNGVSLSMQANNITADFLNGIKIKQNYEWFSFTPAVPLSTFANVQNQTMVVNIQVAEHFGLPLVLNGTTQDKFFVTLNDDFTGLVSHTFLLRGRLVS